MNSDQMLFDKTVRVTYIYIYIYIYICKERLEKKNEGKLMVFKINNKNKFLHFKLNYCIIFKDENFAFRNSLEMQYCFVFV
jgi:hypothetical protein